MKYRMCVLLLVFVCLFAPADSPAAYPADPTSDTKWPYSFETEVSDIQSRFNAARTNENSQLGTSVPMLEFPSQSDWHAKSDEEKALWLINQERIDRGLNPLQGLETNVTQVATDYAQYLLDTDTFSHNADGNTPWERLNNNPSINACHDFLNVAENLAVLWGGWTLPIERAVYMWMYDDSGSGWGHRHAILWYPYNDNSGPQGAEGFLGIGLAGGEHRGWSDSDIIVMNVFDPCSTWCDAVFCAYDFNDDGDVDGTDLVVIANQVDTMSIASFAQEFGTLNCGSE
nr:CAP domain-containing protein [uncultured Desulfobacter sp.]